MNDDTNTKVGIKLPEYVTLDNGNMYGDFVVQSLSLDDDSVRKIMHLIRSSKYRHIYDVYWDEDYDLIVKASPKNIRSDILKILRDAGYKNIVSIHLGINDYDEFRKITVLKPKKYIDE